MKYRDTSRIVTLYTRRFGKLSAIAKGARDPRSKFGSALEPLSYVTAVLYKKESRELQLLTQCDLFKPLRKLTDDIEKMSSAMAVVELVDAVTHAEEENEKLFCLLAESLEALNSATKNMVHALYIFEVRLLDLMGFRPNFHECLKCGGRLGGSAKMGGALSLHLSAGGVYCTACSSRDTGVLELSWPALKLLQRMQEVSTVEAVTRISVPPAVRNEVGMLLRRYFQSHVEGFRSLKSEAVFSSIL
jgi:DNA repair protein RecO (recombination protein O)